jgi:hypothetical protein
MGSRAPLGSNIKTSRPGIGPGSSARQAEMLPAALPRIWRFGALASRERGGTAHKPKLVFWGASQRRARSPSHEIRGSIAVSISARHAEDPGSIPGRGGFLSNHIAPATPSSSSSASSSSAGCVAAPATPFSLGRGLQARRCPVAPCASHRIALPSAADKPKRRLWVLTQACEQIQRVWTSALALISQAISPPPGLEPGSLGREPSILASQTLADSDVQFGRALDCLAVAGWDCRLSRFSHC